MALFVHLTSQKNAPSIRRNGIRTRAQRVPLARGYEKCVFAMPVTDNFYISHQWLRELKRDGQRVIAGVYFRIPDDQQVLIGHYNANHESISASEAVGLVFNMPTAEGFEVLIPRRIEASEIHDIRKLPHVLGWRYYPGAHGNKPCPCSFCQRGTINSQRIRKNDP